MTRPRPTVAEVIRSCVDEFLEKYSAKLTPEQRRALKDLTACRTAALGGHVLECLECGHQQIAYNSCGNRHCPTCQATAAARWLEAHAADLLPVPYFHLVFTLPNVLDPLALANPRIVYDLLLRSAAETVLRGGSQSGPARCPCRRISRAAHLGPELAVPPSRSLRRAGRRLVSRTAPAGSARGAIISYRCRSLAACFAASSWRGCARRTPPGDSVSPASPLIKPRPMLASSNSCRPQCVPTGWSMPNAHSVAPRSC